MNQTLHQAAEGDLTSDEALSIGEPSTSRTNTLANAVLTVAFVFAIFLPAIQRVWPVLPEHEAFENRSLAERPAPPGTWESVATFPAEFENYFDDHFGFRNTLIRWNNLVRVEWLGATSAVAKTNAANDRPQGNVAAGLAANRRRRRDERRTPALSFFQQDQLMTIRGKEGWLFRDNSGLREYYQGKLFTEEELAAWVRAFDVRGKQFAEQGVRYVVVVGPNAHSIYPEFLPRQFGPLAEFVKLDQLANAMRELDSVSFIDLRPALREASKQLRSYHRTDAHWNDFGAYVAYREIMLELERWLDSDRPWELSQFEIRRSDSPPGRLAQRLGLADRIREDAINLVPLEPRSAVPPFAVTEGIYHWKGGAMFASTQETTHPNGMLPRAVILHDSFAWTVMPYLSEHFSYANYVFFQTRCDVRRTMKSRPDVVIQLFNEVLLTSAPPTS